MVGGGGVGPAEVCLLRRGVLYECIWNVYRMYMNLFTPRNLPPPAFYKFFIAFVDLMHLLTLTCLQRRQYIYTRFVLTVYFFIKI
jgi:hypothetical protein